MEVKKGLLSPPVLDFLSGIRHEIRIHTRQPLGIFTLFCISNDVLLVQVLQDCKPPKAGGLEWRFRCLQLGITPQFLDMCVVTGNCFFECCRGVKPRREIKMTRESKAIKLSVLACICRKHAKYGQCQALDSPLQAFFQI